MKRKKIENLKTQNINLTTGPLASNILRFSLPLVASNLLQALFNMADIAVVGRFAGSIALGSVGSTTIIITLTTGVVLGMGSGVNAVSAMFMGGQEHGKLRRTVHTAFLLCLAAGLLLVAAGLFLSRPLLILLGTKPELLEGAVLYLMVYLLGSPALAVYNYGNGMLSAVGDTRRPVRYLMTAGIVNVILNLIFVLVFRMGVLGVALASMLSQYLSAGLIVHYLLGAPGDIGLHPRELGLDPQISIRVLMIGVPSAIQFSLFSIANLCIQSAINTFPHQVVEGNAIVLNADYLVYDVMNAFYVACTSFIAQNYGAGHKKRIVRTYFITTAYAFFTALGIGLAMIGFQDLFLGFFTLDTEVIRWAKVRLFILGLSNCLSAFMDNATAAARGIGKSVVPTLIVIAGSVLFRLLWLVTIFRYYGTLESLYLLYPFSWMITALAGNIYFFRHYRSI